MITITQNNSICQVETFDAKLDKLLKQELSYQDQSVSFSLTKNIKEIKAINQMLDSKSQFSFDRTGMEKRLSQLLHINRQLNKDLIVSLYHNGTFPTGLLPRVEHILSENGYEVNIKDLRRKPKTKQHKFVLKESFPALRYYQKEAANQIADTGRGILVLPTGSGKSILLAKIIWDIGVNTLIVTPGKAITDMMMDVMLKHFGKGKVEKLNSKTKQIKKPIAIVNIQALIKMNPSVLKDIDAVFVDEFHRSAAETYREVNINHLKNVYFRVACTATNFRNDGSDMALESVLSNVLYEYPIKQAIKDGFLMQPEFEIIDNESWDDATYQKTYKAAIVENENRNDIIAQLAQEHFKDQVLILVQQIEHGETIKSLIPNAVFIHGEEKDIVRQRAMEDFKKGKIKCLIGSAIIGEGVDIPNANVLIMAGGGKAASQTMQQVGRVLRICKDKTFAKIYDFADHGSEWLHDHAEQRQDIFRIYLPD